MAMAEGLPDDDKFANIATALEAPHFDPDKIAERLIWPVVDDLWRGDWRNRSFPGIPFQFPRSGKRNGQILDVCLIAASEYPESGDEDDGMLCCVTIDIQTVVTDALREHILEKTFEDWGDARVDYLNGYTEDDLVTKTSVAYVFQSGEVIALSSQQVNDERDGGVLWSSSDFGDTGSVQTAIYEDDLEKIGQGLVILTGSPEHDEALELIRREAILKRGGDPRDEAA